MNLLTFDGAKKFFGFDRPDAIPENDDMTIEMALVDLSGTIKFLKKRGVDLEIVSDTIINSLDYSDINRLCSRFDSFLRSARF